jgi:hypothetical protein
MTHTAERCAKCQHPLADRGKPIQRGEYYCGKCYLGFARRYPERANRVGFIRREGSK